MIEAMPRLATFGVTVILVVHNDRNRIAGIVREVSDVLSRAQYRPEVLVVDDASTDQSGDVAREAGAHVVTQPMRLGYAAAVRAGVDAAHHETIALFDADGGYQTTDLVRLLSRAGDHAMVVGSRPPGAERGALSRRFVRAILRRVAASLAGCQIPDLNSGLRVFQRRAFQRFAPLARGFALTTVLTLGMLGEGLAVAWVPVAFIEPAQKAAARPFTDVLGVFHLAARMALLFNPLKALALPGYIFAAVGLGFLAADLWRTGAVGGLAILLTLLGAVLIATAFLADLIVTTRKQ